MRLVLASASPRRRELLAQAGFRFEVRVPSVDETPRPGEPPAAYVQRLALEKARAVLATEPDACVLGADTTVVLDGRLLGKPADDDAAADMLRSLSGRTHLVHTGIAAVSAAREHSDVESTEVTFRHIGDDELQEYVASGDPLDKAGAYGIQGYAARWIPRITGDYFNVVGLPIAAVVELLNRATLRTG